MADSREMEQLMDYKYRSGDNSINVKIEEKDGKYLVAVAEKTFTCDISEISANTLSLLDGNKSVTAHCAADGTAVFVSVEGSVYKFEDAYALEDELASTAASADAGEASGNIKSNMPGKIWKMLVSEGETVTEGQTVVILESMKMEHSIKTGVAGTVEKVHVKEGDQVGLKQPLVDIIQTEKPPEP